MDLSELRCHAGRAQELHSHEGGIVFSSTALMTWFDLRRYGRKRHTVCGADSNNSSKEHSVLLDKLEAKTQIVQGNGTYWPIQSAQTVAGKD